MLITTGWASNKGIVREDNQDSCYTETFENTMITAGFAAMCDGMGGLSDGGYASRSVCDACENWFQKQYTDNRRIEKLKESVIVQELTALLVEQNEKLVTYGNQNNVMVGTTASLLLIQDDIFYIIHAGDSRVYRLSDTLVQITDDDSVAARKMRDGEISQIEYENSKESHVLTQCIGVNRKLEVHCYSGTVNPGDVFFLCSDGMYHCLEYSELKSFLTAQRKEKGSGISMSVERLIDRMISKGETDNITGVVVCCV